ncbi:hypothetical protein G6F65_023256 [Rhizopus arrhizus]|nr:hypothetical protein G6F65_023256 [Rhizopus arrhizus]
MSVPRGAPVRCWRHIRRPTPSSGPARHARLAAGVRYLLPAGRPLGTGSTSWRGPGPAPRGYRPRASTSPPRPRTPRPGLPAPAVCMRPQIGRAHG